MIIKRVKNKKRRDWGEIIGSRLSRARAHELRVTRELSCQKENTTDAILRCYTFSRLVVRNNPFY